MVRSSEEAHTGWKSSSLFSRVDGGHLEKQVWTRRPFMLGGHTQYLVAKLQYALVFLLLKIPSNEKIRHQPCSHRVSSGCDSTNQKLWYLKLSFLGLSNRWCLLG